MMPLTGDCAPVLSGLRHLELLSLFGSHNIGKSGIRAIIDALEKLEWVDFGETQVDDDGVETLFSRSVESIAIRNTRISDQAFHKAGLCRTLTKIDAANCAISDTSVMYLAKCEKLEAVNFAFCKNISTRSVDYLSQMRHLKSLDLSGCRHIAADSFAGLSNLKKLEKLSLGRTRVTDDGVHAIACLESLDCLDLFGCTGISARALEFISEIKSLKKVRISKSGITQALSITAVREKYPGIEWG
jgi:F-box and leucine-rich repeat protein 14